MHFLQADISFNDRNILNILGRVLTAICENTQLNWFSKPAVPFVIIIFFNMSNKCFAEDYIF